ncbi:hypothetical protein CUPS4066_07115 [Campylobacter upsaliensis]|uniref:hypothetical protein n=1 Tax=Campylobacter upsaliensis TaxID=28080 RepID=UPI00214A8ACA|nr:hypothetical protein [Campylobacter upsaliensis]MCR2108471.1 hypothetical protein [Campylobacter upsaliensis]
MLQSARSSDSKSFLRELEDALVLINNEKDSLKDKINTLLANQENISRASRVKDILKSNL